jgi:transposase
METMEQRKTRPRRSFTPEFKAEIVGLCQRGIELGSGKVRVTISVPRDLIVDELQDLRVEAA